ncbi:MAG: hypothetical protein IJP92_06365 [Lachnospiraceae bacterium]|nr:hypothetical protein [Lachnospiraceae bacterium]
MSDAKRIAEDKLGFTYTELNPDDYFHERRLGDQSGIVIKGHEQGAPFDEMYFLPCASGEDAIRLYNRSIEDMSRTWDETEDSFWGMYYVSDAGIYVYVCRKENMVIEITRTSSDGGGPWSEEEYERYNAMEKHNKEAFEEFIHSDFQIVW